jgi:HSP20 family protein
MVFYNLDRFFDYATDPSLSSWASSRHSSPEVKENEKEYSIRLEIPGYSDTDLSVNVKEGMLHLSGKSDRKDDWSASNRSFKRSYYLPSNVDQENIEANVKNGVLVVKIPKLDEKKLGRQIQVKLLS